MKNIFCWCILAGMIIPAFVFGGVVDTMWLRIYPGSDSASGNWNQATDIEMDRYGNIYVCGAGEKVAGNTDMLIAKFNQWGETLWVRSVGGGAGSEEDMAQALAVDSVGNVFVVGATEYATPYDMEITWLKFSPGGTLLWSRRSWLPEDDIAYDVAIGKAGDVYLCGAVSDTHHFLSAFWVARVNPDNGNLIWTRSYILDTNAFNSHQDRHPDFVMFDWDRWDNCAAALAISPDSGHIVVTGFGYSDARSYQVWTMKFLPNGTRRWAREHYFSLDYDDAGFDVAVADNGYVFVAGFEESDATYYDATLLRYGPDGSGPTVRRVNDPMDDEDYFFSVVLDDSNPQNVYATGAYYQSTTSRFDIITYKANLALTPRWGNAGAIFSTTVDEYGFDIAYNQGRIYVAGQRGNDLLVLCYTTANSVPKDTLWSFTYNSPYNQEDFGAAICASDSNRVFVAGQAARTAMVAGPTDLIAARLFYPYPDMGVERIVAPGDTVGYLDTVIPQVLFVNTGNTIARFSARLRIGSGYNSTVNWNTPVYPGESCLVNFASWIAESIGKLAIACTVAIAGDRQPLNNLLIDSVLVLPPDVGCLRIVAPVDTVDSGAVVQPRVWVRNYGGVLANFPVRMVIGDGYQDERWVTLVPGESAAVSFTNWQAVTTGTWGVRCSTRLAGDNNPVNDRVEGVVVVRSRGITWPPGWREVASLLASPSGRQIKDGGWLAADADNGMIYAAKGYKVGDFYRYDVLGNSWVNLAPWLGGREGRAPYKGSVGCYGGGFVWATKGNNTLGFWRYWVNGDSWQQLADVLPGNSGKNVKGGTDMVYLVRGDTPYVYLLKGYKTDFLRYNTITGQWQTLPDAPSGSRAKWDRGSWLVYDGANTLYAHKAKYHELWAFDLNSQQWRPERLIGVPFTSGKTGKTKKSKDGGSAAWFNGAIYSLKGGNTCEFWMGDPVGQLWTELDTIPQIGSTGRKKRVKGGGDIVYALNAFWAFKGNKTLEFWRYGLPVADKITVPGDKNGPAEMVSISRLPVFQVVPSVSGGEGVRLRYDLPGPRNVTVSFYDRTGRLLMVPVTQRRIAGSGEMFLGTGRLASGVYIIRLDTDDGLQTVKMVVRR